MIRFLREFWQCRIKLGRTIQLKLLNKRYDVLLLIRQKRKILPLCCSCLRISTETRKTCQPQPLYDYFQSFQTIITILQQKYVKKCPSSIWCWDLNPQPSGHESATITPRPGLLTSLSIRIIQKRLGCICASVEWCRSYETTKPHHAYSKIDRFSYFCFFAQVCFNLIFRWLWKWMFIIKLGWNNKVR